MGRLPLVLAIEPDLRQAAIVKRVVKERVQAEVVVVDSRDAAIAAIRTAIPDVVLVSMLLSPRDEDDLIQHLRTLEGAAHLQTHTIPQLASALGRGDAEGGGGLFSAFRRKKPAASAPEGCDPDLFADEIRLYLERAAERKREAESGTVTPLPSLSRRSAEAPPPVEDAPPQISESSWASPFEWRPSNASSFTPSPSIPDRPSPAPILPDPPTLAPVASEPPLKTHVPSPLSVWARTEKVENAPAPADGECAALFGRLGVPLGVALVAYPEGVRIRRVRVRVSKESHPPVHGAVLLGKRVLAGLSGTDRS